MFLLLKNYMLSLKNVFHEFKPCITKGKVLEMIIQIVLGTLTINQLSICFAII